MKEVPCHRKDPHPPHVRRSAITQKFVWCPGGPALRWEGDDS